jgi:hypothetical protein
LHSADGFEVASLGEILAVRGVDDAVPIVFGGPGTADVELEGAPEASNFRFNLLFAVGGASIFAGIMEYVSNAIG